MRSPPPPMDYAPLLFLLFAAAAVALAWFSHLAAKKRREELAALAQQLGWRFSPGENTNFERRVAQFEIFRRGHSRHAYNQMNGRIETEVGSVTAQAGDYSYKETSGSGKSRRTTTYHFSYLIVDLPWPTPALLVRPEGVFDKIAGAFGFDDIDFESAEFSRRFYVKSDDKRFAYDVLHPRMMEFLLAERPPLLDIEGGACCLSEGSGTWTPARFRAGIAFARSFLDLWPRHLQKDLDRVS